MARPTPYKVYPCNQHTLYQGEVAHVLQAGTLAPASIHLVFADPPYNIGKQFADQADRWPSPQAYYDWTAAWLDLVLPFLHPRGSLYLMCATQALAALDRLVSQRLTVLSRIVWHYDSAGVQAKRHFGSLWEPILHCVQNPKDYTFNAHDILIEAKTGAQRRLIDHRKNPPAPYATHKVPGNVWYFPRVRYRMPEYEKHPTQKPEQLLERIIRASSNPGDTVLDLFAGTHTTAAVASRLGRISLSIERVPDYVQIGRRRLGLKV